MQEHQIIIEQLLKDYRKVLDNPSREKLISDSVQQKCAVVMKTGTLATWTPSHSTGRSPKDTYIVKRPTMEKNIDWTSPNCIPMDPETFEMLFNDAIETLKAKKSVYALNRVVGADSSYALPITAVSDFPLSCLFLDNMFRPVPKDINKSVFAKKTILSSDLTL